MISREAEIIYFLPDKDGESDHDEFEKRIWRVVYYPAFHGKIGFFLTFLDLGALKQSLFIYLLFAGHPASDH